MENAEGKTVSGGNSHDKDSQCIRVAVHIRPLITTELMVGCTDCIAVVSGEPQVQIGSHTFTFDNVYGSTASPSSAIFSECVTPLVDAFFHGYNATVLAYGQTGSGKTYTMGTNYSGEAASSGIIPRVMETIFSRVEEMKETVEFLIRVSFIEIFKEEVFDLLDPNSLSYSKSEGAALVKHAVPARLPIQIRETGNGGITLAGVIEAEVRTKEEMASYLSRGSLSRATGSTNMNSQSSRSHAIFTICMEQKRNTRCSSKLVGEDDDSDDILCAKLHLVDLAGSERAKRTGADGLRLKEGIHINKGLLALGNVISALGDEKKRKEGGHVPYRDSKLTRLLQDSLGGNSKTVMIACVSPADTNAEETLNTLKYANRARNIQNKAIINRDPAAAQMQRMRSQIEQLQAELLYFRGEGGTPFEELQILRHKISLLEASNAELHRELQERRVTCDHLAQRAIDAQVEKDKLILRIESTRDGKPWENIDSVAGNQEFDLVKTYVSKIQELEGELMRLQSLNKSSHNRFMNSLDLEDDVLHSKSPYLTDLPSVCDDNATSFSGEIEEAEKEMEHSSLQDKLDKELRELDKRLQQKEAEMKQFATVDTSVLKNHFEKKVQELEQEKRAMMKEIEELRSNLASISSASDDGAQKLKGEYLQKLNVLEVQVSELKKKQDAQSQLLRQKQKSDEAAKRLQEEIQRIKSQKVQLQHKIKQESEQFRSWRAAREKEVLQLKKEGRRNEYEMHKLLSLNQRQKMVLQRKTEEAAMATKRLKELLETRKAASRETFGVGNKNGPGIQALMQAIEHEIEITVHVHEVRSEYERQKEARAAMANEVSRLKEESEMVKQKNASDCLQMMSPGARNSRIFALENMLATSSSTLVSMASQLSEVEEHERAFNNRSRWNQVRSVADAKNVMNYLFNLASSSRCLLRDKEVGCKEKDTVIRELKEKVVKLSSLVKQMEAQNAELLRQQEMQKFTSKNTMENLMNFGAQNLSTRNGRVYDLRQGPRNSIIFSNNRVNELLEDMDLSESEGSETEAVDDEWVKSVKRPVKRRASRACPLVASHPVDVQIPEKLSPESSSGEISCKIVNPASDICCSCSRGSLCKTSKCECRAASSTCGESCGCKPTKCSNREAGVMNREVDDQPLLERAEDGTNSAAASEIGRTNVLASHGAMLLQSALSLNPVEVKEDHGIQRKALSDIGNTLAKSNAPKPDRRKKWRKSVIQLVPELPPSSLPQGNETSSKPESSMVELEVPLKLPRAMKPAMTNNNFLRERNSNETHEPIANKDVGMVAPRSPQQARDSEVKENHGI